MRFLIFNRAGIKDEPSKMSFMAILVIAIVIDMVQCCKTPNVLKVISDNVIKVRKTNLERRYLRLRGFVVQHVNLVNSRQKPVNSQLVLGCLDLYHQTSEDVEDDEDVDYDFHDGDKTHSGPGVALYQTSEMSFLVLSRVDPVRFQLNLRRV